MNYFYTDADGKKQGPLNLGQLKGLVAQKVIKPDTLMETEAGNKGIAGKIPGLFAVARPPSPIAKTPPSTALIVTIISVALGAVSTIAGVLSCVFGVHRVINQTPTVVEGLMMFAAKTEEAKEAVVWDILFQRATHDPFLILGVLGITIGVLIGVIGVIIGISLAIAYRR